MQLAMENNLARLRRDKQAIQWLAKNLTYNVQDSESLALGIPGSFDTTWGVEVWKFKSTNSNGKLYGDIGRLFETCSDHESFESYGEWRRRSRACTEAIALLVLTMGADIRVIRNSWKLLSEIGSDGRTREVSEIKSNPSFATRWTCLSLVATQKMLHSLQLRCNADDILRDFARLNWDEDLDHTKMAFRNARRIDEQFAAAWDHVKTLRQVFTISEARGDHLTQERISEILLQNESELTPVLDQIASMERLEIDASLSKIQKQIDEVTHDLILQLPGVAFDDVKGPTTIQQILGLLAKPVRPQLIYFSKLLRGLCGVNQELSSHTHQDIVKTLQSMEKISPSLSQSRLMERQLWRLQDLTDGAFGFSLELYFLSIGQLLSTFSSESPLREIHKTVLVNTFKAITSGSDWQLLEWSIGTRQVILDLICDIAVSDRGIISNYRYPDYIKMELLDLLGRMVRRLANMNIEDVVTELSRDDLDVGDAGFRDDVLKTIRQWQ